MLVGRVRGVALAVTTQNTQQRRSEKTDESTSQEEKLATRVVAQRSHQTRAHHLPMRPAQRYCTLQS